VQSAKRCRQVQAIAGHPEQVKTQGHKHAHKGNQCSTKPTIQYQQHNTTPKPEVPHTVAFLPAFQSVCLVGPAGHHKNTLHTRTHSNRSSHVVISRNIYGWASDAVLST
jgi:hypothetical protein